MFAPAAISAPRPTPPAAASCHPCPWPALLNAPTPQPHQHRFSATDCLSAAKRCTEVAQERPTWPRSRVRALVAREMNLSTVQLRYLLHKAETMQGDTPALAA